MPKGIEVLSLHDIGFEAEIDETGTTLEENSVIKAQTVAAFINDRMSASLNDGMMIDGVFADDTGLEIDALGGKPGVYTARWAMKGERLKEKGEREIFAANRAKALRELADKDNRACQFRTVITLIRLEDGTSCLQDATLQVEGIVRGKIATEEYGEGGFGYDPIFIPDGYDRTFGELPAELKNGISHRARALQELVKKLKGER